MSPRSSPVKVPETRFTCFNLPEYITRRTLTSGVSIIFTILQFPLPRSLLGLISLIDELCDGISEIFSLVDERLSDLFMVILFVAGVRSTNYQRVFVIPTRLQKNSIVANNNNKAIIDPSDHRKDALGNASLVQMANGMFINMWTIKRGYWYRLLLAATILSEHVNAEKQKRQIFREQVLPALGGKIPEEAFRTDRLALNRLNKEGITVPDGVLLDARHVHKHPHPDQRMPEVIKVYLSSDGRYVPPEGRSYYNPSKTIDTTYIIRKPFMHTNYRTSSNLQNIKFQRYPRPQAYSNYRFLPIVPPVKSTVYKPIITPLTLPADRDLFDLPTWDTEYDWDTVYEPYDESFVNNIALFNSHQIITDYQGFLNEFYGRSLRHVGLKNNDRNQQYRQDRKYHQESKLLPTAYEKVRSHIANSHNSNSAYTSLTTIPKTSFSCRGRKGVFADIETKCQVFHDCSDWSKVSSLCPPGTAFCEANKRCEWFNTVQCK